MDPQDGNLFQVLGDVLAAASEQHATVSHDPGLTLDEAASSPDRRDVDGAKVGRLGTQMHGQRVPPFFISRVFNIWWLGVTSSLELGGSG